MSANMNMAEEALAGEFREMIALGWTDEEARTNEEMFFDRIGSYADGLTKDDVWRVWDNVYNDIRQDQARAIIDSGLYEAAEALMDDEIREDLNREMAPCTEEAFLAAYMDRHYEKYGIEFIV